MKRKNRFISFIMIIFLSFSMLNGGETVLGAQRQVIKIQSVDDLMKLAWECRLDTWSQGKEVHLMADLDMSRSDFKGIPTFGGSFEGNGHRIKGLSLTDSGAVQGLFRYIQKSGKVKNLIVEGRVQPQGTKSSLGGVAGINSGMIKNCSFLGELTGENDIGGITGVNEVSGQIIGCTAQGEISGKHYVGGIAGENLGTILNGENKMNVNTVVSSQEITLEDLEKINLERLNSTENTTAITDIGGIAGFSTGIIQGCSNTGTIGYQHIGYNVGGIVGRQSGYVKGCVNQGLVYGRKDVGGIVGQLEPYITLDFTEGQMTELKDELNVLQTLMNQAINHADSTVADASTLLNQGKTCVDEALNSTSYLLDEAKGMYDETIDSVNNISARVTDTLDRLTPVLTKTKGVGRQLEEIAGQLVDVVSQMQDVSSLGEDILEEIKKAVENLKDEADDISENLDLIEEAFEDLRSSLGDEDETARSLEKLTDGMIALGDNIGRIGEDFKAISNAMKKLKTEVGDSWKALIQDLTKIGEVLANIRTAIKDAATVIKSNKKDIKAASKAAAEAMGQILEEVSILSREIDLSIIPDALDELHRAMKELKEDGEDILDGDELENIGDLSEDTMSEVDEALEMLQDDLNTAREMSSSITDIIDDAYKIIADLADEPVITLPSISSQIIDNTHALTNSLRDFSNVFGNLNESLSAHTDILISDIEKINDQLNKVINLVIDSLLGEDEEDDELDLSKYQLDISDEDTENSTQGKITECSNENEIQGDLNVGGIAGSMAIEYDFDPEDDVTRVGKTSVNFKYLTKAVISRCTNYADITSKKDSVGGIVGYMDLGTVSGCTGYGRIEGKDGDYVGGIAGTSNSHIKESFAMCELLGKCYIGGIAGYANRLTDNYSMVEIESGIENMGAIAGGVNDLDKQSNNVFVDRGVAAIDSISYTGKASPVSYEEFVKTSGLPEAFTHLKLTFIADEKLIKEIPFKFGESIDEALFPEVPSKEGYYGKWPEFDKGELTFSKTLEAVYMPYRLVVSSELKKDGKAVALIEGNFDEKVSVDVKQEQAVYPELTKEKVEIYNIAIEGLSDQQLTHPLRLLCGKKEKANVYAQQSNGSWKKLDSIKNGSYLLVTIEGSEQKFYIAYETAKIGMILTGIGAGAIALIGLLIIRRKKKNNEKKVNI